MLTDTFQPETNLERSVQSLLKENNMDTEKSIHQAEELGLNKLSPEEVIQRRGELAKLRSLLFYSERKAQRAAKIKSKLYHRIKKKEKERNEATTEELQSMDPENERLELERLRAEERVSQRHQKKSKWAKKLANFREQDEEVIHPFILDSNGCIGKC